MNWITEYWHRIQSGEIKVCNRIRKQYEKLSAATADNNGKYYFDEQAAERPITFIETFCKNSKGEWAGKTVHLELFQKAFISALFGFLDKETGLRQYREALLYIARKNGKSTLLAGIALYMLLADGEPGAEVYSIATKKDQARLIYDETHNMIKQSAAIRKHVKKRKSDLYFGLTFSKFQALGKNSDTLDGLNSSCVIIDELHGIKDRNLYEVMKQSQAARQQPLLIMITTAGTIRESIFDDMYSYACNIVDGVFEDDHFLAILYELDKREEWTNPEAWIKANPALGSIKKVDDMESKIDRAKNNPVDLNGILIKDFNIRNTVNAAWLSYEDIDNPETFKIEDFINSYAVGGADLSITTDLTCASLVMMDKETNKKYVSQMYWLPEDLFERRVKEEKIPYDKWLQAGFIRLCYGNTINYKDVTAWFVEMARNYKIFPAWIYYDSYSARYWVQEMTENGFNMVRCIQGAKTLSLPMQNLGADLKAKKVIYNNNPVLKWCLTNTGIQTDRNGNIVPIKNQAPKQRIDGTASLLDAYVGIYEHYQEFSAIS